MLMQKLLIETNSRTSIRFHLTTMIQYSLYLMQVSKTILLFQSCTSEEDMKLLQKLFINILSTEAKLFGY